MLNLYKESCFTVVESLFHTVVTACYNNTLSELDFSCNLHDLPHIRIHETSTALFLLPNPYSWGGTVRQPMHRLRLRRSHWFGSCSSVFSHFDNGPMSLGLISSSSWQQSSTCWLLFECSLQPGVITAHYTVLSFTVQKKLQDARMVHLRSCNVQHPKHNKFHDTTGNWVWWIPWTGIIHGSMGRHAMGFGKGGTLDPMINHFTEPCQEISSSSCKAARPAQPILPATVLATEQLRIQPVIAGTFLHTFKTSCQKPQGAEICVRQCKPPTPPTDLPSPITTLCLHRVLFSLERKKHHLSCTKAALQLQRNSSHFS